MEVFTEYFKELEEESIRDNFVIIYELLDEMMDFGYPQTTESKILQESVMQMLTRLFFRLMDVQVHHARVVSAGGSSEAADRCDKCCVVAIRGYSVPKERGLPGCH